MWEITYYDIPNSDNEWYKILIYYQKILMKFALSHGNYNFFSFWLIYMLNILSWRVGGDFTFKTPASYDYLTNVFTNNLPEHTHTQSTGIRRQHYWCWCSGGVTINKYRYLKNLLYQLSNSFKHQYVTQAHIPFATCVEM